MELIDWDIRDDVTNDGQLVKIVHKRSKANMEKPNGIDEVIIDIKIFQKDPNTVYFEKKNWTVLMDDENITTCGTRILETMRVGEVAEGIAQPSYFKEHDQKAIQRWGLQEHKELHIEITMHEFCTIIDWYNDRKTLRKTLKRGYSRVPFYESTVVVRFKIDVNGVTKFDNLLDETELNIAQVQRREKREIEKLKKKMNELKVVEVNEEDEHDDERENIQKEIEEREKGLNEMKFSKEPL